MQLVGICDTDGAKARAAQKAVKAGTVYTDASAMLSVLGDLDIIDIVTPPHTHLELVKLAVACGVPTIICQKPLADTLDEAREIVRVAEDAGARLVVHENFRWQPWHREIRALLHAGAIGEPYQAAFYMRPGDGQGTPPAYVQRQPYFLHMKRFLIHETGVHLIDVFRFFFGEVR